MAINFVTLSEQELHHAYREIMRELPSQGTVNVLMYTPWDLHKAWLNFSRREENGELLTFKEMWFMEAWGAFCRAATKGGTWRELREQLTHSASVFCEWEIR